MYNVPSENLMDKRYHVYYVIKMNGVGYEYRHVGMWHAANAKQACSFCKAQIYRLTGRNAFRPHAVRVEGDQVPEGVHTGLPPRKYGWKVIE